MSEYRKYKGYYIGKGAFNNEDEIDAFLKEQAIKGYKQAVWFFCKESTMEASIYATEKAEYLHKQFGMSWSELEAIEIEVMENVA
jgi:hypothetical protein